VVSRKHIELIKEMVDAKKDLSPKLEKLVKERFRPASREQ